MPAGTCPACGLSTDEAVCPRCATILLPDRATCPTCGKAFPGRIAVCYTCGAGVAGDLDDSEEAAVRTFALVPGLDERTARRLYVRGFREFADVIKLGLPDTAVRRGLHRTISRKILLASVLPKAPARLGRTTCLACHATVIETDGRCPVCGAAIGPEAEEAFIGRRIADVHGSIASLADDPDFRSMPDPVREEILSAMGSMLEAPAEAADDEFHRQVEAWREKGFDVGPILVLLAQHPSNFRDRAVRLIRAQIRKKMEGGTFRCPLCDDLLEPSVEECGNCGAKFA